jgi:hypothetical protein
MAKLGRNQPCPCGSGKKYKLCCLHKDEAATGKLVAARVGPGSPNCTTYAAPGSGLPDIQWDDIGLDNVTNGVVALVSAGKLDQAEQAARELLVRYPRVVDGYHCLGMVFDARGDRKQAAHFYAKAVAFIEQYPVGFNPEVLDRFRQLAKLDPDCAA